MRSPASRLRVASGRSRGVARTAVPRSERTRLTDAAATYELTLAPGAVFEISVVVSATTEAGARRDLRLEDVIDRRRIASEQLRGAAAAIASDHQQFNLWIDRARTDLHMLLTETPDGFVFALKKLGILPATHGPEFTNDFCERRSMLGPVSVVVIMYRSLIYCKQPLRLGFLRQVFRFIRFSLRLFYAIAHFRWCLVSSAPFL